jgi:predicted Zn-dependent protease
MKRFIYIIIGLFAAINVWSQDSVFTTMKSELDRNFAVMKTQPIPAYYISLRLEEEQALQTAAELGNIVLSARENPPSRTLGSSVRVGSRELDNTRELRGNASSFNRRSYNYSQVPLNNNPAALKNIIWQQLDKQYKDNVLKYEQVIANMSVKTEQEDKTPDFSQEKAEKYYEKPISLASLKIDPKQWEDKVRKYSAVFAENPDVIEGQAYMYVSIERKLFIDTEGREIAQNFMAFRLVLSANAVADDGMDLPLYKTWMAWSLAEMPTDEEVIAEARTISKTLSELRKAPVAEAFSGPAILEPEAAGVFFHEIFGHRIEGARLKQEADAQTFKKKIGELVLPDHVSVYFDPAMRYFEKTPLNGHFVFDDEGIRGEKVDIVKNGKLTGFLMSRVPIDGFPRSNGHGRGQIYLQTVTRQSNLIVESKQQYSEKELVALLRKEAAAQGKDYAYLFKDVSGGFTSTDRIDPNVFNVEPLVVYRIYADGRPDELVRGVDLVGTPLAMFAQIAYCGKEKGVFNGTCGAESGGVPVSSVSPSLLVKKIETQKRAKSETKPPLLPAPTGLAQNFDKPEDVIPEAIRKEQQRALDSLQIVGLGKPFFISSRILDAKQLYVSTTNGFITQSYEYNNRILSDKLLVGDYKNNNGNFEKENNNRYYYSGSGSKSVCEDNNEKGIRSAIWTDLDSKYKSAAENYEQKQSSLKNLNIPQKERDLPDWDIVPKVQYILPSNPDNSIDRKFYEQFAEATSSVFNEYPELFDSNLRMRVLDGKNYFANTENSEYQTPYFYISLSAAVHIQTSEGEDINRDLTLAYGSRKDLPSAEEIRAKFKILAEKTIEEAKAEKVEEAYTGPVLFENEGVWRSFYIFLITDLNAARRPLTPSGLKKDNEYGYSENRGIEDLVGKRIASKGLYIEDLTGTRVYGGEKLIGFVPVDAQGVVPPERLPLVENGILKNLLNDRIPTHKAPHSNGHSLITNNGYGETVATGVFRISDTIAKPKAELKSDLLRLASEEGYDYAYIVRNYLGSSDLEIYRVSVADGKETRVRAATLSDFDRSSFRKILAVSDKEQIYNGITNNGLLFSAIAPDAILFEDLQITAKRDMELGKAPVVAKE